MVGVEAPLFGPGVGLKAMGRIRALPCSRKKKKISDLLFMMNGHEIKADSRAKKVKGNAKTLSSALSDDASKMLLGMFILLETNLERNS